MFKLVFSFVLLLSLSCVAQADKVSKLGSNDLIGGRLARDGELPFSVFLRIGNSLCTGSLVGQETVLTAGHCVEGSRNIEFNFEGIKHNGSCTRHPDFSNQTLNNDFALCKFSPAVTTNVFGDLSPVSVNSGEQVTLQGFGQNRVGTLQVGEARIEDINGQDIKVLSSVKLGGGDSGGGLILGQPDLFNGPFQIIGVNSRVQNNQNRSFFNRINLQRSQDFFRDFANNNRVDICGINVNCIGGGGGNNRCDAEADIVKFFEDELRNAKNVLNDCLRRN